MAVEHQAAIGEHRSIAAELAGYARRMTLADVPAHVAQYAKLCIADAIGIGLASTSYEFAQRSAAAVESIADGGTHPVIGLPLTLPPRDAAMLNGILVHGLDFDDTHPASIIHCSASAVPLVLAAGLQAEASGPEALAAYILAVETAARIGQVADGQFQTVGVHPTGAVGIFGCVLACGMLHGLSEAELTAAQGIALSLSSGSLEFLDDGSWTKRLHPGWAAASAITATALAANGFEGPAHAYEGRYGLYNLFLRDLDVGDPRASIATLGQDWELERVAVKPYPVCHFNHAFIDAALALRDQYDLAPDDIESVTALIHEGQVQVVCEPQASKRRPVSDYDAKFSLQFDIAAALVRRRFTLDELEPDALGDEAILGLCDRVGYETDPESAFPRYFSGAVRIRTRDGRELMHREAVNRGADRRQLDATDIREKFDSNAARAVSAEVADTIWQSVMALDAEDGLARVVESLRA